MKIVFASANPNKIKEINALLGDQFEVVGLKDIGISEEIPEPGDTIKDNSFLKANYVFDFIQKHAQPLMPVFADDSGLEVDALDHAPGVNSATFAGTPKNDSSNNLKLLAEMKTKSDRKAAFVTVITLLMNGATHYFDGKVEGTIAHEPRGGSGFGYDPLFIPRGYRSTFAELGPEIKNNISHRAIAVNKLVSFLAADRSTGRS